MLNRYRVFTVLIVGCLLLTGTSLAGPKETLHFGFEMVGGVEAVGSRNETIRGPNSPVWIGTSDLDLAPAFHSDGMELVQGGDNCFSDQLSPLKASLQIMEDNDGSARVNIYFTAWSSDGKATEIKYWLILVDSAGWAGLDGVDDFPPRGTTVTMEPDYWAMITEGRGQLKKVSCTGEGGDEIVITLSLSQP